MATFADALWVPTPGQQDAISCLASADSDARPQVLHWIAAWDKAMGRGDTVAQYERYRAATRQWAGHIFIDGAGI